MCGDWRNKSIYKWVDYCQQILTQIQVELQRNADGQRENFDRFVELTEDLGQIVNGEDAQELDGKMRQLTSRYDTVGKKLMQYNKIMR